MSISLFCIVSSYAAGFGGGQRGGTFGTSGFGSSYISTYLSYDALSDLCVEVNYNLQHNVYASDGLPSSGNYAATIVSRNDGYYIGVYKDGSYIWFRNPSGGFYIAKFDSDSILSSISSIADSIDSRFSLLMADNGYLSSIDSRLSLLMADNGYLSSIDSRLSLLMADNGFLRAFLDNFRAIVSRLDTIVDLLSMSSDASAGASVSLSSDALYTNFGTIGQLAQAYQDGTLDPSTTFPTLNAVVVGLLGLAQKIDAVDLNPKVEVIVKEAEYAVSANDVDRLGGSDTILTARAYIFACAAWPFSALCLCRWAAALCSSGWYVQPWHSAPADSDFRPSLFQCHFR